MPIYTYKCKKCGEMTEVLRSFDDSGVPPDKCDHCDNDDPKEFDKKIGKNVTVVAGGNWGGGKGYWMLLIGGLSAALWLHITSGVC